VRFVLTVLYCVILLLTSLSMLASSFCSESMSSANGLSARYLTLFQVKDLRYWSAGSGTGCE